MEITPHTKINTLLNTYPELELFLMNLNPKYKKLKNPVLRRTVAKIATLTQVAKIGGYEVNDLVNKLRQEVGQEPLEGDTETLPEEFTATPKWITNEPAMEIDVGVLLEAQKNPLAEATIALKSMKEGDILLIHSDFLPSPLIDTFKQQGYEVYAQEIDDSHYLTFIKKADHHNTESK
jgi:TusA-related sulfurtransferase